MFLFCAILCIGGSAFAQQTGDYRSAGSGNWTNPANWEVYNGTAWVAATNYPGQVGGTNTVTILGGDTISLGSNIPFPIQGLVVGDGVGGTDTLQISNTATLDTPFIDLQPGGFAIWTSNVSLFLPAGSAFIISGGTLDNGNPCSAAKRLVIGPDIYATCNGAAGADYSFQDLIDQGGTLSASPTSNSPLCEGADLTLLANPSGTGASGASFSWTGTGPGGYSFSSTDENPIVSGLSAGTYTYEVTITEGSGISFTAATEVTVEAGVTISTQPVDQQGLPGSTVFFTVTATNTMAYQWQVSTDGGSSYTDLADGPKYTGSQTASLQVANLSSGDSGNLFRVRLQPLAPGCPTVVSAAASLTVRPGTVVTNRRITYRVNN